MVRTRTLVNSAILSFLFAVPAVAQQSEPVQLIERLVIVQGSVGQPGRERAFLNCYNPDQVGVGVTVHFVGANVDVVHAFVMAVTDPPRVSVDLATVPDMPAGAYFSLDIYAEAFDGQKSGLRCALTHHRASDFAEVATERAEVVRSPKR